MLNEINKMDRRFRICTLQVRQCIPEFRMVVLRPVAKADLDLLLGHLLEDRVVGPAVLRRRGAPSRSAFSFDGQGAARRRLAPRCASLLNETIARVRLHVKLGVAPDETEESPLCVRAPALSP